jgi:uncharacterized protein
MNSDESVEKFRALLDENYNWPDYYEFKFIVRMSDKDGIVANLQGFSILETPSKKGNYVSISARKLMKSTQEVLDVYQLMGTLKGIMFNL